MRSLSRVRLSATPWTAAYQAPPSMGFSRQEYWSGVPLPSPNSVLVYPNLLKFILFLLSPWCPSICSLCLCLPSLQKKKIYIYIWNASQILVSSSHRGQTNLCTEKIYSSKYINFSICVVKVSTKARLSLCWVWTPGDNGGNLPKPQWLRGPVSRGPGRRDDCLEPFPM